MFVRCDSAWRKFHEFTKVNSKWNNHFIFRCSLGRIVLRLIHLNWIKFFITFQHALILYIRRLFLKQYICLFIYQVVYSNITTLCSSHQMAEELKNQEILKYCILSREIFNNKCNCNCNLIVYNVQQTTSWSLHRDLNRSNDIKNKYTLKSWQVVSLNSETNNSITNVKNIENGGCQCEDTKRYLRNKPLLAINVFVYRK